jgi:hypothetical protein
VSPYPLAVPLLLALGGCGDGEPGRSLDVAARLDGDSVRTVEVFAACTTGRGRGTTDTLAARTLVSWDDLYARYGPTAPVLLGLHWNPGGDLLAFHVSNVGAASTNDVWVGVARTSRAYPVTEIAGCPYGARQRPSSGEQSYDWADASWTGAVTARPGGLLQAVFWCERFDEHGVSSSSEELWVEHTPATGVTRVAEAVGTGERGRKLHVAASGAPLLDSLPPRPNLYERDRHLAETRQLLEVAAAHMDTVEVFAVSTPAGGRFAKVYWGRYDYHSSDIALLDLETGAVVDLTGHRHAPDAGMALFNQDWAPDGALVSLSTTVSDPCRLNGQCPYGAMGAVRIFDAAEPGHRCLLYAARFHVHAAVWAPRGDRIALLLRRWDNEDNRYYGPTTIALIEAGPIRRALGAAR